MTEQAAKKVEQAKAKRTAIGEVVSAKMQQTIVVLVVDKVPHPKYKKYVLRSTKLYAHDESNQCKEGDKVQIELCRPLSKNKCWKLVKVIN